jgi:hypothetical protein
LEKHMSENLDLNLARQYFQEAAALFDQDRGELWGVSLKGPMIFVDYETRAAAANQPDGEGRLRAEADLFTGSIPPEVIVANTAMQWAGVYWTMVMWQALPEAFQPRAALIGHEAFHRIQAEVGFPISTIPNANIHLDGLQGIRCYLTPQAAMEERALEMNEGLAEYTGVKLSGMTMSMAVEKLRRAPGNYPSFVRSFAYASGPAYGLLLDKYNPGWRQGLTTDHDLGELLCGALKVNLPADLPGAAQARALEYDGPELMAQEITREQERQVQIAAYRSRLVDGPVLILPLSPHVQCGFDPRSTLPIEDEGTVFPWGFASDAWGVLHVERDGLLIDNTWDSARVVAPGDLATRPLIGDGWRLEIAEGWTVKAVGRLGDFILAQVE